MKTVLLVVSTVPVPVSSVTVTAVVVVVVVQSEPRATGSARPRV